MPYDPELTELIQRLAEMVGKEEAKRLIRMEVAPDKSGDLRREVEG